MIAVQCPHCSHAMQTDPAMAGQAALCAKCGGQFTVPFVVRQTTAPKRVVRRKSNRRQWIWFAIPAAVALLLLAVAWLGAGRLPSYAGRLASPEFRAVDRYLRENLPEPTYEVILQEGPFSVSEYGGGTSSYVRLKYRSPSVFGGRSVSDYVFSVENGEVSTAESFINSTGRFRRYSTLREWAANQGSSQ